VRRLALEWQGSGGVTGLGCWHAVYRKLGAFTRELPASSNWKMAEGRASPMVFRLLFSTMGWLLSWPTLSPPFLVAAHALTILWYDKYAIIKSLC
jgi:hypothetical protein